MRSDFYCDQFNENIYSMGRLIFSLLIHLRSRGLFLLLFFQTTLYAAPVKIDFEDLPQGSAVINEYLAKYGVRFNNARICKPANGTASGVQALMHATSLMEFSPGPLIMYFEGPQSRVRLAVGLNNNAGISITATLQAFDGNGNLLATDTRKIGPGKVPVVNFMEVKINDKKIRQVRLQYEYSYFEVIDDLEFDDAVAPPPDDKPPVVKITKPLPKEVLHSPYFELRGTIQEDEGLLNVTVAIQPLNQAAVIIQLSHSDYDDKSKPVQFYIPALGTLHLGENKITVTATDIGNNTHSDAVTVLYFPNTSAQRKLGVYSLSEYEIEGKDQAGWKNAIAVGKSEDPYEDFWDFMVNGPGAYSVNKAASVRYKDQEITLKTIIPAPGSNLKSWDDFDMVFFYGHNNAIIYPGNDPDFDCYVKKQNNYVKQQPCNNWGSALMPFDYYASGSIKNAGTFPGAVIYLYPKYTASLLGDPYDYGGGEPEGAAQYYREHFYDTPQQVKYGKLGSKNLKWLILHGCQAVVTAYPSGNYIPLAYYALSEVHGGYHIILGHYRSFYTIDQKPLKPFGFDLICGVPVQTAYFDTDPDHNTSAIAAEDMPFSWNTSTMATDTWLAPVKVPSATQVFSQRWIVWEKIVEKI